MTARVKCKKLTQQVTFANVILTRLLPIVEARAAEHKRLEQKVKAQQQELEWYQELYDKARKAQIKSAAEAEALRREIAQLRADLAQPKSFFRRLIG